MESAGAVLMPSRQMSWHVGYPLSQTILTSVYVESILMPAASVIEDAHFIRDRVRFPPSPMHQVLNAYCLGLLKACGQVNERISCEHYYEVSNPSLSLVPDISVVGH
jgi:hypothetical protein